MYVRVKESSSAEEQVKWVREFSKRIERKRPNMGENSKMWVMLMKISRRQKSLKGLFEVGFDAVIRGIS